jgi:hypothetical protein
MVYSNIEDMFGSHAVRHNVLSIVEKALEPLANPILLHMVYSLDLPIEHGASSEDIYCYGEKYIQREGSWGSFGRAPRRRFSIRITHHPPNNKILP